MKLSERGELSLIDHIKEKFSNTSKETLISIGDDTAVFKPKEGKLMLTTTDTMAEGVHFDLSFSTFYQLGFKLVSVNVSDIYAMNGIPEYIFLNISVNANVDYDEVCEFFDGIETATNLYGISLLGGDTTSSKGPLVFSATIVGYTDMPVSRRGAKVGDGIFVTGSLGDSACGLEVLKQLKTHVNLSSKKMSANLAKLDLTWELVKPLILRHLTPVVKSTDVFWQTTDTLPNSLMDLSDGLAIDLQRLCKSSGVGALVYEDRLPISYEMQQVCNRLQKQSYMELALCGGEDYELIFTSKHTIKNAFQIGEIIDEGLFLVDKEMVKHGWPKCGYEHFRA